MYKKSLLALLTLVIMAAAGMLYGYLTRDDAVQLDAGTKAAVEDQTEEITVYVTGAVNHPGVVSLAKGARVVDAVDSCGGLLPTADADKVNLAAELKDGMQVRVPETAGAAKAPAAGGENSQAADGRININIADEKTLDGLPGVGPATAKRIVEYREANGPFQAPEDLKKVHGIGEAKFAKLKEKVML
jgi:competence protein ComEA